VIAASLGSGIAENLRFLVLEVRGQLLRTRSFLAAPDDELAATIAAREDYVDNLRRAIHRRAFGQGFATGDENARRVLQAAERVADALERIADRCLDVVEQVGYLEDEEALTQIDAAAFLDPLLGGVDRIERALFELDARAAVRICRAEARLDELYERGLAQVLEELENGEHAHTQVTLLLLLRQLEQMGDVLLLAGEAILSACLGESIKASRLWVLDEAIAEDGELGEVELEEIAETRSGARIRRVDEAAEAPVILKDGALAKLTAEREGNRLWRALDPGLAPRALDFQEQGDTGAIVYEFAAGQTFEDLVLCAEEDELRAGYGRLLATLRGVWARTREDAPAAPEVLAQLERRLPAVYAVHPEFRLGEQRLGGLEHAPLEVLIERLRPRLGELSAPFTVLAHGDLNLDNVILGAEGQVRFLDLHRTHRGDYAQDVAVFLVSHLRLSTPTRGLRRRLSRASQGLFQACRELSRELGDPTFEARLALGLARSCATSSRFLLAPGLARTLFHRARYLLERLAERDDYRSFTLPPEVLHV